MENLPQIREQSITSTDPYFSTTLKWMVLAGSIMLSGYLIVEEDYLWILLIMLFVNLILFSARYLMVFDLDKKVIVDSFQVLWINLKTERIVYDALRFLRFDKLKHSYAARSRAMDRKVEFNEYVSTLEYDDKFLELERSSDYQSISNRMKNLASTLHIPIHRTF
jgi:hypothetical protein